MSVRQKLVALSPFIALTVASLSFPRTLYPNLSLISVALLQSDDLVVLFLLAPFLLFPGFSKSKSQVSCVLYLVWIYLSKLVIIPLSFLFVLNLILLVTLTFTFWWLSNSSDPVHFQQSPYLNSFVFAIGACSFLFFVADLLILSSRMLDPHPLLASSGRSSALYIAVAFPPSIVHSLCFLPLCKLCQTMPSSEHATVPM
ncbi:hypothetical protein GEMRC1_012088 [Eukaryota sp. GEM-RC1]